MTLAEREDRLGPGDKDVVKYRRTLIRKLRVWIRQMGALRKTCKHEETVHKARIEIDKLKEITDALKVKDRELTKGTNKSQD